MYPSVPPSILIAPNDALKVLVLFQVLKKFPVVQHFLFGNLFSFDERTGGEGEEKKPTGDISAFEKVARNRLPLGPITE